MSKKEFNYLLEKLEKSKTEDEVYSNLKNLLRESSSKLYKHRILDNPYFRSLIPEVRNEVLGDINIIRESLKEEIESIDIELTRLISKDLNNKNINKLKELKRECISLIYEIDERKKDLNNLF